MVLDYSKWDALELSDDSDIEVHPNVDKRSFIRAKQNQIHVERQQRRHHITTWKYERIINEGLLFRIDRLLVALRSHRADDHRGPPEELIFQALIESAGNPGDDQPPPPPEGVHTHVQEHPSFSKIMAALVDQVKKEVDEQSGGADKFEGYIAGIEQEKEKVQGLQGELLQKLAELEKIEATKITSDSIHTGFDRSQISQDKAADSKKSGAVVTTELLNAKASSQSGAPDAIDAGQSSGADADVEDGALDEDSLKPTALGEEFAKIRLGDYQASLKFISAHPVVLSERESDCLLAEAFNAQSDGKEGYARQCVHQALLIQYCRQLGRDGVGLFFKRVTTPHHQAQNLFLDDVRDTYNRIKTRTAELAAKRSAEDAAGGVEQIQLHAVDPNTQIHITVPPPVGQLSDASAPGPTEDQLRARALFETFPPGLQRALEGGNLDHVNKVLAKMSVEEAEEIVDKMGQGNMLNLEEGVIDATTEEGQKVVEEIERTKKMPHSSEGTPVLDEEPSHD